ncbi:MAG: SPOCS domain-containing protein [Eubacterium sp.]
MELIKKEVKMRKVDEEIESQFTLDDDYTVPDTKPPVGRILRENGSVKVDQMRVNNGSVKADGHLEFAVLYSSPGETMAYSLAGMIPFSETFNMAEVKEGDMVDIELEVEDLRIEAINPFKLNVRAVIKAELESDRSIMREIAVEAADTEPIDVITQEMEIITRAVNQRDVLRIKDMIEIPASKPGIYRIIWSDKWLKNISTKVYDGSVEVSGEIAVFVLYAPEEDNVPMQWASFIVPFSGSVEVKDARDDMIGNIDVNIGGFDINAASNSEGEQKQLDIEAALDLDINLYEEEEMQLLDDVYSPYKEIETQTEQADFEKLLIKNSSKIKVTGKVSCGQDDILQVINTEGKAKIYEITQTDNGVLVEGALMVSILYMSSNDAQPIGVCRGVVPISHVIEVPGLSEDSIYKLKQYVEQVSANVVSGGEVEIKANIILDIMAFDRIRKDVVTGITESMLDPEIIRALPAFVFYIVQKGDSLWSIAKNNYTTVENLKKINELTSDQIKPGDRLLIVKQTPVTRQSGMQ